MRGKGESINKEEIAENWCFVCKDGGDLRICDNRQCPKSYHHSCLKKPESFLESEKEWDCDWHRCSVCSKSSYIHCYTCPKSVCYRCVSSNKILQVKGKYGFCKDCLNLALLIEENKDCDSYGCKVDFTDRETEEGLHMEYYTIVKEDEGFELADVYAAKKRVQGKKRQEATSGAKDCDEEEEPIFDYDYLELQKRKRRRSLERSDGQKPTKQTPAKANKENLGTLNPCKRQRKTDAGKSSGKINDVENKPAKQTPSKPNKENLGTLNPCKRQREMDAEKSSGKINDVENKPSKKTPAKPVKENIRTLNPCERQRKTDASSGKINDVENKPSKQTPAKPDKENLGTLNPCERKRKTDASSGKINDVENKPSKQTPAKPEKENLGTLNPCERQRKTDAEKSSGKINDVENKPSKQTPEKPDKENLGTLNPCERQRKTDASSGKINDVENKPSKQMPAKPEKENLGTLNPCERQRKTDAEKSSGKMNDVENKPSKQTPEKPDKENLGTLNPCERQRKTDTEKSSGKINDVVNLVLLKSRFASIVVENLKRVYLGRGVLKEMLKEADSFEEKVTGCFVRVKSSSYNHRSRSHQLVQVKGVKTVSIDENNTETVLLLSATPNEIGIPLVSDEEITEEECENLRKKVLAGEMERPTVEYLQRKVNDVHKDMTNLSIRKELNLLNHRIEQANENGWRPFMFDCLERRKKLQSPRELTRLLGNVPTVIADVCEPDCDSKHDEKGDGISPESNNGGKSPENCGGRQISPSEKDQIVSKKPVPIEPQNGPSSNTETEKAKAKECEDSKIEAVALPSCAEDDDRVPANFDDDPDNVTWCMKGSNGLVNESVPFCVLRCWYESRPHVASKFTVWREGKSEEDAIPLPEALKIGSGKK